MSYNSLNYAYQNMENYCGLSNNGVNGNVHTREGYQHKMLRQLDGKSYVVVNPQNPDIIENMGSFSLSAAVRPPYMNYPRRGCPCGRSCGCDCKNTGTCNCPYILGVS